MISHGKKSMRLNQGYTACNGLEVDRVSEQNAIDYYARVSDDDLDKMIIIEGGKLHFALWELRERRRAEKMQWHTDHRAEDKNGTDRARELENVVLPLPCTKGFEDWTVKQWFQKINEELDEFKDAVLFGNGGLECRNHISYSEKELIAEEAVDTITAITSMLEAMGIDEQQRQEAQRRVNEKNRERGRL